MTVVAAWLPAACSGPPPAEEKVPYSVMKDWSSARVEKPVVAVLTDEAAYTKLFAESYAAFNGFPKPVAEKVDFKSKQVVAVCWGAMSSTFYDICVVSVTGSAKETTIAVKTTVPKGIAEPAITYPAVVVVIPKSENVRVVVTGDRLPMGVGDFTDLKKGLEVKVVGTAVPLPAASPVKPDKPVRLPREIDRPNRNWDYDGTRILGHVGDKICLWDAATGKLLHKMQSHKERLCGIRFSPDGGRAFTSSWRGSGPMVTYKSKDTRTVVWNLTTGEMLFDLKDQVAGEFSADGGKLVTFSLRPDNSESFDATIWDALQGRQLAKIKLPDYSGPRWDALHFSADGSRVAHFGNGAFLLYNSGRINFYNAADGSKIGKGAAPNGNGHRYTSPGALASFNRQIATLTDAESGKEIASVKHDLRRGWGELWTHDGKRVAAIPFGGGEIEVCESETGKVAVGDKTHPITSSNAIVSPDNTYLAVESGINEEDKPEVRLYVMNTGKEIARIKLAKWGHMVGFSPDGKTLLIGGSEFVIYDAENGKKIRSLKLLDDVSFENGWHQ